MPPKTAFFFGAISATALLAIVGLIVIVPMVAKGGKGTVAGAVTGTPTAAAPSGNNGAATTADITKVSTKDNPYIGDNNAPVTVAFWTDYQCPFCKQFDTTTLPSLISQYVDKGKVKIVFKDFAFLGNDSTSGAMAARAVWDVAPKKFLAWHEAMYDKQDTENGGWGTKDDIIALTRTISGIDADKVSKLMDQNKAKYQQAMEADKAEGSAMGVSGTPGFVIGKQLIAGAEPTANFVTAIDAELAKK